MHRGWALRKVQKHRSSPPEVYLGKGVLKMCSKFTGEHPAQSVILTKLLCNFIEIALWHRCSPVNLLRIFRTPFPKNNCRGLLLKIITSWFKSRSKRTQCVKKNSERWVCVHKLMQQECTHEDLHLDNGNEY